MPCDQFMHQIQMLSGALTQMDWLYIESHGTYQQAKTLARQKLATLDENGQPTNATAQMTVAPQPQSPPKPVEPDRVPAPSAAQRGAQYQGPTGFANAPVAEAGIQPPPTVLGPNGEPLY
jgi:hypothetical protein